MKRLFLVACLATSVLAQSPSTRLASSAPVAPVTRVANDGLVIDRVGEASKRDLPKDLLKRIIEEDIELLRGRRPDGSYEYAHYERFEAGRISDDFSINHRADKMATVELRGEWIYRVIVEVPSRRMLVRRNRPIWVERVDVDAVAEGSTQSRTQSFEVKAWMQPGEVRPFDLDNIARAATVRVIATAEEKGGYGNLDVSLVKARIVDAADSPYAEAVASAKAVQRALDNNDIPSMRVSAQRMRTALGGSAVANASVAAAVAPRPSSTELTITAAPDSLARPDLHRELQTIEDLLTGTEAERREGMDRLHQLIRRMR